MNNQTLDKLLDRYKAVELPRPPINLRQNVWREIRLRQDTSYPLVFGESTFFIWLRGGWTTLAAPALALTLLVSVCLTLVSAQTATHQQVRRALGLEVFSHQFSALDRLAENP